MGDGGNFDDLTDAEFGAWLKWWQRQSRLTQAQLATALDYNITYIAKIQGGTRPRTEAFLGQLAKLTGQSEAEVLAAAVAHAARTADNTMTVPRPADDIIGRDDDLQALCQLVRGRPRCVTLVGPPGIGKSRLAIEAALQLAPEYPGGIWWVALRDVEDPGEVEVRLRRALGDSAGGAATITGRLRTVKALVIFDNFERVVAARTLLSELLEGSRQLKIVVTSQEALGLRSEHVFPVPPLAFPNPFDGPSLAEVKASPAVQLFEVRARMAYGEFSVNGENYGAVLRTCARLDGLPLAIMVTAGALRVLDADQLARAVERRVDVPYGALSDMPQGHDSIDAAIARSWERLADDAQLLLAQLTVFTRGFRAHSVAAVCDLDDAAALALLDQLDRKSLVEAHPEARGGARFELLETIKTSARRHLSPAELEMLCERHARHFAGLAGQWGRQVIGAEQVRCARMFGDELENLQGAFEWSLRRDPAQALAIAANLWRLFLMSDIPTGQRWLADALAVSAQPSADRATALAGAGALAWVTGHHDDASRHLAEAAALARRLQLPDVEALVLVNEGGLAEMQGRIDAAEGLFTDALGRYAKLGDRRGRAFALNGLGMVLRGRGELDDAWPLWVEAARLFHDSGDLAGEALASGNLAWAAESLGALDEAQRMFGECRRLQRELGDARGLAATTNALGRLAFQRAQLVEALELQTEALRRFERLGDLPWLASTLVALAGVALRRPRHEVAAKLVGAAQTLRAAAAATARREEQAMIDEIESECRKALGDARFERMVVAGQAVTVAQALAIIEAEL